MHNFSPLLSLARCLTITFTFSHLSDRSFVQLSFLLKEPPILVHLSPSQEEPTLICSTPNCLYLHVMMPTSQWSIVLRRTVSSRRQLHLVHFVRPYVFSGHFEALYYSSVWQEKPRLLHSLSFSLNVCLWGDRLLEQQQFITSVAVWSFPFLVWAAKMPTSRLEWPSVRWWPLPSSLGHLSLCPAKAHFPSFFFFFFPSPHLLFTTSKCHHKS